MLSTKFEYILNKLVKINVENRAICDEFSRKDPRRTIYVDQCNSSNFYFQCIYSLKNLVTEDLFSQSNKKISNSGSEIIFKICSRLLLEPNSIKLTPYQISSFRMLDILNDDDKNVLNQYLDIYDGYKLTSKDPTIIRLYLDFLLVPVYFHFKKLEQFNVEYNRFFNNLDTVLNKSHNCGNTFYRDYTKDIEYNSNIDKIIEFIEQVKKYSINNSNDKIITSNDKIIKPKNYKLTRGRKKKIPATLRNAVWNRYIGLEKKIDKCFCCKMEPITSGNFECGHIIAECQGGETNLKNLRPICGLCNKSMGKNSMFDFIEKYGFF